MSLLEFIETRRSIRSFLSKELDDKDIIKILNAGRLAPTGFNRQPWQFIYVKEPRILRMVKNCSPGLYGDTRGAIVVSVEIKDDNFTRERTTVFYRKGTDNFIEVLDAGFAAENMLLAAHYLGLGACAIASINEEALKKLLNIPVNLRILLVISLGYPDKIPAVPKKKLLSEITSIDEYGRKWDRLEGLK